MDAVCLALLAFEAGSDVGFEARSPRRASVVLTELSGASMPALPRPAAIVDIMCSSMGRLLTKLMRRPSASVC